MTNYQRRKIRDRIRKLHNRHNPERPAGWDNGRFCFLDTGEPVPDVPVLFKKRRGRNSRKRVEGSGQRYSARKKLTRQIKKDYPDQPTRWVDGVMVFVNTGEPVPGVPAIKKQ